MNPAPRIPSVLPRWTFRRCTSRKRKALISTQKTGEKSRMYREFVEHHNAPGEVRSVMSALADEVGPASSWWGTSTGVRISASPRRLRREREN
ncbi:MAG: hypothetical protein DMG41_15615 [Acidobacteria bacterium]|nr:MAG: hypothetical protein AUH13_22080 [Acidobacteria bacterium 13_2_20CM_58_27]PYT72402.1 MAG: hypothetical protein DMG42_14500 [Acidobacteriota bacterium]PYT87485.1 MAG: hypothetical protein DMG41_15615 [Acidobacteriota bacterium]